MSEAEQAAWSSVVDGLIFNPETAIAAYWRAAKAEGRFYGVPVSDELDAGDGAREMAFSSGAVLHWTPDEGVTVQ